MPRCRARRPPDRRQRRGSAMPVGGAPACPGNGRGRSRDAAAVADVQRAGAEIADSESRLRYWSRSSRRHPTVAAVRRRLRRKHCRECRSHLATAPPLRMVSDAGAGIADKEIGSYWSRSGRCHPPLAAPVTPGSKTESAPAAIDSLLYAAIADGQRAVAGIADSGIGTCWSRVEPAPSTVAVLVELEKTPI